MSLTVFPAFCILGIHVLICALFQMVFAALLARERVAPAPWEPFRPNPLPWGPTPTCLVTLLALSYLPALALGPVRERLLFGRWILSVGETVFWKPNEPVQSNR